MKIENVNNNDFTAYIEALSSYDGSLSFKENIDLYSNYIEQELMSMDLTTIDSEVLMQQYKKVILGNNVFDGTINWGVIHKFFHIIKERMEQEISRRIETQELTSNNNYGEGVLLQDVPYNFEDYREDNFGLPRGVVCTKDDGFSIEHTTALFHATAINMCVQFLLKNGSYSSDSINHKVAGYDASNMGILAMVMEGKCFTIYLPHDITKEQFSSLIKECLNREDYKFRLVHNGVVFGAENSLNYLEAIYLGGSHIQKKIDSKELTLK